MSRETDEDYGRMRLHRLSDTEWKQLQSIADSTGTSVGKMLHELVREFLRTRVWVIK